jgi:hypothetical protein
VLEEHEDRKTGKEPIFSICIPQYNRTSFFCKAIATFAEQKLKDVEICVSDGCSTDGREQDVIDALKKSGLSYVYRKAEVNLRYDANLRSSLTLAKGRYCILMGNDDGFNGPNVLSDLWEDIQKFNFPGVVHNNYCDAATGKIMQRIGSTQDLGCGPKVAVDNYRDFSFVSGVVLEREAAQSHFTEKWDGAEMYQTYIGCRMISSGKHLLKRKDIMIIKDLVVEGETVDAAVRRPKIWPCPITVRETTLTRMPGLIADSIAPYSEPNTRKLNESILFQHLGITMPFWLVEWRRVQSWNYAAGFALGLKPSLTAKGVPLGFWRRLKVWTVYVISVLTWLLMPIKLFDLLRSKLYAISRK